jgi:hypothetical protein
MYVTSLVLEDSGQSESLMAMILALGHWSLGACA